VPGSKTFDFATARFEYYGLLDTSIHVMTDYQQCLSQQYDAVISFEVLEHLTDPVQAIKDIAAMVKPGGIGLISEDFGDIADYLPTHLRRNSVYMGRTPFLFLNNNMRLTWYSRDNFYKPYEFVKADRVSMRDWLRLVGDNRIRGFYFHRYARILAGFIYRACYVGG
jgi:SAM-dependent methyltransferase